MFKGPGVVNYRTNHVKMNHNTATHKMSSAKELLIRFLDL